jgi:hypothetical protein
MLRPGSVQLYARCMLPTVRRRKQAFRLLTSGAPCPLHRARRIREFPPPVRPRPVRQGRPEFRHFRRAVRPSPPTVSGPRGGSCGVRSRAIDSLNRTPGRRARNAEVQVLAVRHQVCWIGKRVQFHLHTPPNSASTHSDSTHTDSMTANCQTSRIQASSSHVGPCSLGNLKFGIGELGVASWELRLGSRPDLGLNPQAAGRRRRARCRVPGS